MLRARSNRTIELFNQNSMSTLDRLSTDRLKSQPIADIIDHVAKALAVVLFLGNVAMWFRASEWSRLHPHVAGSGDVTLPVRQNR